MRDLPVGIQQRVEILKALYRQARVLILDEPTAVLTPQEATDLFRVMRALVTDNHTSIVFITHKLHEVFQVADRIVVLRQGKVVGTLAPREATGESLAAMMVGRPVLLRVDKGPAHPGDVGAARARPAGAVRPRPAGRRRPVARGARGRDPGHRRRPGQRPDRAGRGASGCARRSAGSIELLGRDVTRSNPRQLVDAAKRTSPRIARSTAWC